MHLFFGKGHDHSHGLPTSSSSDLEMSTSSKTHLAKKHSMMSTGKRSRLHSMFSSLSALIAVLALSFHAIFEGLAVGLESNPTDVWYLMGAVAAHKFVIAFCVGVELLVAKTELILVILSVGIFAIVTPLGKIKLTTSDKYFLNLIYVYVI